MSITLPFQPETLYDNQEDQTRIVQLSAIYDGLSGCYHAITRKFVIFERREDVVLQWHGGLNAPVELRLTFSELDALIEQFNAYCEDYDHSIPDGGLPSYTPPAHTCTCPICTSQDARYSSPVARPSAVSLLRVRDQSFPASTTERCSGSCCLCPAPCAQSANHHDSCFYAEHSRT